MPDVDAIVRLQARLADALLAPDPVAALGAEPHVDPDGLRIAALLIAKLRFQRLMNASPRANEWFARDPAAFTAAFRCYHQSVAPHALDPWRETASFEDWCRETNAGESPPRDR